MELRFLGKDTQGGGSPMLFDTDQTMHGKEVYVLQGWKITDPDTLAKLDIPDHETVIAVPKKLLSYLPKEHPMALLRGDGFRNLFRTFNETAFHLELKDSYHVPEESGPFSLFLDGKPDDFAWHEPWLNIVREATRAGKRMTRVRVVTVPHSDYTRWGLTVARLNIAAGEDIRWLPRRLAKGIEFPPQDYWLFDDTRVVFTEFHEDGRFLGGTEATGPQVVAQCRHAHEQVWSRAISHAQYMASQNVSR